MHFDFDYRLSLRKINYDREAFIRVRILMKGLKDVDFFEISDLIRNILEIFERKSRGLFSILRVFRTETWLTVYRPLDIILLQWHIEDIGASGCSYNLQL